MENLSLEQGSSVVTMLAVAAVAILLTGWFYARAFHSLKPGPWRLLFLLRVAAILLIVLLLFRPMLSYQNERIEKPSLIFLLDRSASMSISDDTSGVARFDQARGKLREWREKLKKDFRLKILSFAEQAEVLSDPQSFEAIKADGKATSLSRALQAASQQFAPAELAAAIVLSDGIQNMAGNPVDAAKTLHVPVHVVGVGAGLRNNPGYRDIQVTGIECPDRMMLNNVAKITGSIDAVGMGSRVVQVYLDEDDKQVGQTELTLDDVEGPQSVAFEFRPTSKGRHVYTVRTPAVSDERIVENNQRSDASLVVEPGIHVLYVEGTLRPEYGALVDRFLAKDPDLEFCALVQTRPNVFLKRTNMADLRLTAIPNDQESIRRFDVFIFGDIDSSYFRPEQQELFLQRIRDGGGAIMLGGYHSLGPGGYGATPLGEVLPVKVGGRDIGQWTDPFLPTLTPDGVHHPIFNNIADYFPTQQGDAKIAGLPLLDGCTCVESAKPGATVLATCTTPSGSMPVFAVQPLDHGRIAVFTGDTTKKWQQGLQSLGQDTPFLRFWGQTVRWLAGRSAAVETQANVVAVTDKAVYDPGEAIQVSATLRDKDGQGTGEAAVTVSLRGKGNLPKPGRLDSVAGSVGHYAGQIEPRAAGEYEVIVEARIGETVVNAEPMTVQVGRPNLEFERLDLDEKTLAKIASEAGGRYVSLASADYLIDQLDHAQRKKTVLVEQRLYWPPGFWAMFVIVLTAEWTLRRKYQLR